MYVTDSLQALLENTSGSDKSITQRSRFYDLVTDGKKLSDNRTPEEVVQGIKDKIAGMVGGENGA